MKEAQAGMEQLVAATVLKVTDDTRTALEELNARDLARDRTLHDELNAMATKREKGRELLAAQGDTPQLNLDAAVARMSIVARLQSAESKVDTLEAAVKDAQAKIDRLNSSGRTVGAQDTWQP